MAYRALGAPVPQLRATSPIGVGRAVCPTAGVVAVTDRLGLGYADAMRAGGLGDIFSDIAQKVTSLPIIGPAIAAGYHEFERRATGAVLQTPEAQAALKTAAVGQGQALFQEAAPWLVGGLLLWAVLK